MSAYASQKRSKKNLKRKSLTEHSEDTRKNFSQVNGHDCESENTQTRPFWDTYCDVYEKLTETASEVQTTEDCIVTTRIVDLTSAKLAQEIQKLDLSSVDHWVIISSRLVQNWDRFFYSPGNENSWSLGNLIPLNRYKSNCFTNKQLLLKRTSSQEDNLLTQKKKRTTRKDDNVRAKISKPLEGMVDDKPLPLIEHMKRVMNAIERHARDDSYVEYLRLVIDPDSFSSTAYNIFTVSFLIREGLVSIKTGSKGEPLVKISSQSNLQNGDRSNEGKGHFVIDFTTNEWKALVKKLNIRSPAVRCPKSGNEDDMFYEQFTMSQKQRLLQKQNGVRST